MQSTRPSNCKQTLFYLKNLRETECTPISCRDYRNLKGNQKPSMFLAPYNDQACNAVIREFKKTLNECFPEEHQAFSTAVETESVSRLHK